MQSDESARTAALQELNIALQQHEGRELEFARCLPSLDSAAPMLFQVALQWGNAIVDRVQKYSSSDHGTNFRTLLLALQSCIDTNPDGEGSFHPNASNSGKGITTISAFFDYVRHKITLLDINSSIDRRYWTVSRGSRGYRFSLSISQRRSALTLVSEKAEHLGLPIGAKVSLKKKGNPNLVELTLAIALSELAPFQCGLAEAWNRLISALGFSSQEAKAFLAYIAYLKMRNRVWYQQENLWKAWRSFVRKYRQEPILREKFNRMLDFYSTTVAHGIVMGLAFPFVRIGDWYAYWPFCYHVLHPDLTLVSIITRKRSTDWDNTIGSDSARIAVFLLNQLPKFDNLLVAALRKKKPLGDIDLAIYDRATQHLLVCEIKTTFDRFRTNYQRLNFTDQRVNYDKANSQLTRIRDAIASGEWHLSEIFAERPSELPLRISCLVLTWWDIYNPNLGTPQEDILCSNFRCFQYLYLQSRGDLDMCMKTMDQLSKTYCVAKLHSFTIQSSNTSRGQIFFDVEKQSDSLPPISTFRCSELTELALAEIESIKHFPENWRTQLNDAGDHDECVFY